MTQEPTSVPKGKNIAKVYSFDNGMTMVFDQFGQQMPDFQGPTDQVVPMIRAAGYDGEIVYGFYSAS